MPSDQATQLLDLPAQRFGFGEHRTRANLDQRTRLGRLDRPRGTAQQLNAELSLEASHLVRQR